MLRLSMVLTALGFALLIASALPWPAGVPESPSQATQVDGQVEEPAPTGPAGAPESPSQATVQRGKMLFAAKGCGQCHRHAALTAAHSIGIGPDLTHYSRDPEFLRAWLNDPGAVRPGTAMPNLALSRDEIEALIVFLNAKDGTAGRNT